MTEKAFEVEAEQLIRDGDLRNALDELQNRVRSKPEESRYRIFLFQLLSILGQWERAMTQLKVIAKLDPGAWPMVNTYKSAILCEKLRSAVFAGQSRPMVFGEPTQWLAWLLESMRLMGENRFEEALSMRNQAFDMAPPSAGMLDETPFHWIADADSRLGPILEVFLNGQYYWVPFCRMAKIVLSRPADLRDLVWIPAEFTWINGGQALGLIPVRYPGSETVQDSALQLARRTEWRQIYGDVFQGIGQRMLATDQDSYPLLDTRMVLMDILEGKSNG